MFIALMTGAENSQSYRSLISLITPPAVYQFRALLARQAAHRCRCALARSSPLRCLHGDVTQEPPGPGQNVTSAALYILDGETPTASPCPSPPPCWTCLPSLVPGGERHERKAAEVPALFLCAHCCVCCWGFGDIPPPSTRTFKFQYHSDLHKTDFTVSMSQPRTFIETRQM